MQSKLETMHVKPARNRMVRYPQGYGANSRKPIPAEGATVPADRYFTRRLRCGDLVRIEPPKPEREAAPEPPKAKAKPKSSKPKSSKPKAAKKKTTKASSPSSKAEG